MVYHLGADISKAKNIKLVFLVKFIDQGNFKYNHIIIYILK